MKIPSFSKKRPAHTLLFVTEAKTFRIDVDKTGVMIDRPETITFKCLNTGMLSECVKFISENSRPLGRKVWLLYIRLTINVMSMPSMQVEGLDDAMVLQSLQFELEGLNGVPQQEQQFAYQLLSVKDEMSTYWVSQIEKIHFDETYNTIKKTGSRLAGILHPSGIPKSLKNWDSDNWLRFECWSLQLVALHYHFERGLEMKTFSFDERYWQSQLEHWFEAQGDVEHSETLLNNKIEVLPHTAVTVHLSDIEEIGNWLTIWANVLIESETPAVPILRYTSNVNTDLVLMASGGAVALAIVLIHVGWNLYQANYYTNEVDKLTKLEISINAARKSLGEVQEKSEKTKAKIEKLTQNAQVLPDTLKSTKERPATLLKMLARGRPENLLVETISTDKDDIKIGGICLDSISANQLATYLEKELKASGWVVSAPTKKSLSLFEEGGPWNFEIKLTDLGMSNFTEQSKN